MPATVAATDAQDNTAVLQQRYRRVTGRDLGVRGASPRSYS
jgi:hypothetical protein